MPAIFLTSLNQPIYEELALERGAVDFVEKSRSFSIILKRLRLITEGVKLPAPVSPAVPAPPQEPSQGGPLELRADSCRALWHGRRCR